MNNIIKISFISIFFTCLCLTSCTTDCYESKRSMLGVAFMDSISLKPITVQRLTVSGVGSDSILYNNVSVSEVFLPMHVSNKITEYGFVIKPATDEGVVTSFVLTVNHDIRPLFVSNECGCVPSYEISNVVCTPNAFVKKFEVYKTSVTNIEGDVHIKIYN